MAGECGEITKKKSKTSNCPESKKPACPETNDKSGKTEKEKTCKDAFGRQICVAEEKIEPECHESRKKFFGDSESQKKKLRKEESKCGESTKKKQSKGSCCSSKQKEIPSECAPRKSEKCSRVETTKCGPVNYFAPQCFNLRVKSEGPTCANKGALEMPKPSIMVMRPRLPKVEKGVRVPCVKKKSTIERINECSKKPSIFSEFFCIDARNRKMNECIKQYMQDPSKVNVQCAHLSGKRIHTVTQAPCPESQGLLPPKYRQVAKRWLPAVGVYMVATAALTCWVTEWGEVVNRIPFYRDKEQVRPKETPPSVETPVPDERTVAVAQDEEERHD